MPKSRVVTAARVLGQNPAEAQVDQLVTRWDSAGLTLDQFQQVLSELDDEKPSDEMVSDVQIPRYLMCKFPGEGGLSSEQFDFLLRSVKTTEEGMVKISDIVNLLQSQ